MTQVILHASFLSITIIGYELGANPLWAMFCIGWCSALTFAAITNAVFKTRSQSSRGL